MEKVIYLVYRYSDFRTKLHAVIYFMNDYVYKDFLNSENKRYWLQERLNLPESYFWNTFIIRDENQFYSERDDEYLLEKEFSNSDKFYIY